MGNRFAMFLVVVTALSVRVEFATAQSQDLHWRDKLSPATYTEGKFRMYQVSMPDGIKISAAVWTPDVADKKFPVIMIATPYNKLAEGENYSVNNMARFFV